METNEAILELEGLKSFMEGYEDAQSTVTALDMAIEALETLGG